MSGCKSVLTIVGVFLMTLIFLPAHIKADRFPQSFNQLTRVASNTGATHNIFFVINSGISAGESITITVPSAFAFGSLYDFADMSLAQGSTSDCTTATFTVKTLGSTPSGTTWGATRAGSTTITFTSGTDTIPENRCVRVILNNNGVNRTLTNPNVTVNTVYNFTIATPLDEGELAVIILGDPSASNVDQVSLNAKISSSILLGVDTVVSDCNNNTQTTPANQVVNFGVLLPGVATISSSTIPFICIEGGTNSANGFRILVQSSRSNTIGGLVSASGVIQSATANLNLVGTTAGYGLRVSSLGTPTLGSYTAAIPFNSVTAGDVGQINGSLGVANQIINSIAPVRSGSTARIAIEIGAKASTSTAADSYTDTLTFTAFTNL